MLLSTRGGAPVTASGAILAGLAPDGGLYVPEHFPGCPDCSLPHVLCGAGRPHFAGAPG